MKEYKKVLKKKLALIAVFNGLAVVFITLTGTSKNIPVGINEHLSDMIHGF